MNLELCCKCEAPTGRAGHGDDSIYFEDIYGDALGPLCEECAKGYTIDSIAQLEAERDRLRVAYDDCASELVLALKYIESKPHDIPQESLDRAKQATNALEPPS